MLQGFFCCRIYIFSTYLAAQGHPMLDHMTIQRSEFSVSDFLTWKKSGELNLSPSFQRRPVWNKKAKSYFIDTIIRGLPIPIVFIRERTELESLRTLREVIDGQQRIRTSLSFVDPSCLDDFDETFDDFKISRTHNKTLANKKFPDLPAEIRKRILSYKITTHVLPSDTDDRQILDIFRRMNATGTKLNSQELRNAEYFGEFISSVYDLAYQFLDEWRKWKLFSEMDIARMKEAEFISELYILVMNGVTEQSQSIIKRFYSDNDVTFSSKQPAEKRVTALLKKIDDDYGDAIGDSIFSNKIWFYPLFAVLNEYFYGDDASLSEPPTRKLSGDISSKLSRINLKYGKHDELDDATKKLVMGRSNRKENRLALKRLIKAYF
jgi:Protein of unknown function DUF262